MSVAGGNLPVVNRTDRLYALVEELRAIAPRPRTARQLASKYEVSTRTIERDILALQESGVPVYAEIGRHGGYVGLDSCVFGLGGGDAVRARGTECAAQGACCCPCRADGRGSAADGPG